MRKRVPKSLFDLQIWFAKHITTPIRESDAANIPLFAPEEIGEIREQIAPGPELTSEERLGIYRQQYWWRLLNICQEIFPSLVRLFDYEDFNRLIAEPYLLKYPPNDWFLSHLGSSLPQWVEGHYRENDALLVLGLSRLDLAYEHLLFIDPMPRIAPDQLSECEKKKLYLQPFVFLFEFDVDLFAFRSHLLEHPPLHWQTHDFPPFSKNGKKRYFALYRSSEKSLSEEISEEFHALLARFQKGARLADLAPLLEKYNGLLKSFQIMASRGWLTLENPK